MNDTEIRRLLKLVEKYEIEDRVHWDRTLTFYIICNDFFHWGCADGENIETTEDMDLLENCMKEIKYHIKDPMDFTWENTATLLYCAKKRGTRPQGAYYQYISERYWDLFDACGPEREVSFGNPTENRVKIKERIKKCMEEKNKRDKMWKKNSYIHRFLVKVYFKLRMYLYGD